MFLYQNQFVDILFSFNPNRVMGINGGYFPAICRVCFFIYFKAEREWMVCEQTLVLMTFVGTWYCCFFLKSFFLTGFKFFCLRKIPGLYFRDFPAFSSFRCHLFNATCGVTVISIQFSTLINHAVFRCVGCVTSL